MPIDDGPPGPRRRDPDAIDYSDESFGRYSYGEGRLAEEDYDPVRSPAHPVMQSAPPNAAVLIGDGVHPPPHSFLTEPLK